MSLRIPRIQGFRTGANGDELIRVRRSRIRVIRGLKNAQDGTTEAVYADHGKGGMVSVGVKPRMTRIPTNHLGAGICVRRSRIRVIRGLKNAQDGTTEAVYADHGKGGMVSVGVKPRMTRIPTNGLGADICDRRRWICVIRGFKTANYWDSVVFGGRAGGVF